MRQAISFVRAMQTEQWRSMNTAARDSRYDAEAITDGLRFFGREEGSWEDFFARNGIAPYRLTYEELDADQLGAVAALLEFLGHHGPAPDLLRRPGTSGRLMR